MTRGTNNDKLTSTTDATEIGVAKLITGLLILLKLKRSHHIRDQGAVFCVHGVAYSFTMLSFAEHISLVTLHNKAHAYRHNHAAEALS